MFTCVSPRQPHHHPPHDKTRGSGHCISTYIYIYPCLYSWVHWIRSECFWMNLFSVWGAASKQSSTDPKDKKQTSPRQPKLLQVSSSSKFLSAHVSLSYQLTQDDSLDKGGTILNKTSFLPFKPKPDRNTKLSKLKITWDDTLSLLTSKETIIKEQLKLGRRSSFLVNRFFQFSHCHFWPHGQTAKTSAGQGANWHVDLTRCHTTGNTHM